jgi:methylamine dehydrogenase accessory protein MauD
VNDFAWKLVIVVLVVAVVVLAVVLLGVMRQVGAIALRLDPLRLGEVEGGPEIGSSLVGDTSVNVAGGDDAGFSVARPTVVMFVSPTCRVCQPLIPGLATVQAHYPELDLFAAVLGDESPAKERYARQLGEIGRTDLDGLAAQWDIQGTPYAVGLSDQGVFLAKGVVNTLDHLESLAERVVIESREVRTPA